MSIYSLLDDRSEYNRKMNHPVPPTDVISREEFIMSKVRGKRVLDIGATGPMHEAIRELAETCYGMDIVEKKEANYFQVNLDTIDHLPSIDNLDIIIAGEVIEHLSNAGHFLELLKPFGCPIVLTTPNAFSSVGAKHIRTGIEHVNKEHVCYYSYHTLLTLFDRHGFEIKEWHWYNGSPLTAEGILCLLSSKTH